MSIPEHETIGYRLPEWTTTVDRERQKRFHKAINFKSNLFSNIVDVSVLSNDCLHGARPRDNLGDKRLHVGVRVRQNEQVFLGEPLTVRAQVDNLWPDKRGHYISIGFELCRDEGSIPIRIDHKSLILRTSLQKENRSKKHPPERILSEFKCLRRIQITPDMVRGYSFEFPYLAAHHDPEAAAVIGMRAPIAQGLMGFSLLFREAVREKLPQSLDMEASFKRPIFWDDFLDLEVSEYKYFRARNRDRKTVSELLVHDWK